MKTKILGIALASAVVLLSQTVVFGASTPSRTLIISRSGTAVTPIQAGHLVKVKTAATGAPTGPAEGIGGRAQASPQIASASCYRSTCKGLDPVVTGCSATQSTASYRDWLWDATTHTYIQVWNRWSSGCQTNWPKIAWSGDPSASIQTFAQYGTGAPDSRRWDFQATVYGARSNLVWGNMLDGGAGTQCVTAWGDVGGWFAEAVPSGCV